MSKSLTNIYGFKDQKIAYLVYKLDYRCWIIIEKLNKKVIWIDGDEF